MSLRVMPLSLPGGGWTRQGSGWAQRPPTVSRSTRGRDQIKQRWERKLNNKAKKKAAYKIPFPHYHSQAELVSELTYLAGEFSEIAELVSIGRSVEGREIT